MREPTPTGGAVRHSTESMLTYHSGAFVGSPANAATSDTGRRITVSVTTSTSFATVPPPAAIVVLSIGRRRVLRRGGDQLLMATTSQHSGLVQGSARLVLLVG